MFQDSVPAGSYNDPFLSSVISMVAPTWCHGANWRQPSSGWVLTDLNSEFTHFNLVIHLSNAKQSAFLFCTFCEVPRLLSSLEILVKFSSTEWRCAEHSETSYSAALSQRHFATLHENGPGRHTTFRCGDSFFWWLSGEVKHFVHLIRWNLEAVLCHCGTTWPRSRCRE